jgi:hypothetical protein
VRPGQPSDGAALRNRGITVVIVGGLLFVLAVAVLHWAELPKLVHAPGGVLRIALHEVTLWHFKGDQAGALTVIAAGTAGLAAAGLLSNSVVTVLPAACGSFYLLGQVFPWDVDFQYGFYRVGFWVATALAVTMAAGGVVAVVGAAGPGAAGERL